MRLARVWRHRDVDLPSGTAYRYRVRTPDHDRARRLGATPLAFLGATATPYIVTLLAIGELIADQLPKTPSRKVPVQFGARLVSGGLCGAAIGATGGALVGGLVAGVVGAVIGTLGGYQARVALAKAMGRDLPAAALEDVVAIGSAAVIVAVLV